MKSLITALLVAIGITSFAQEFRTEAGKTDYITLQKEFQQWSQDNNLDEKKGWKWYKRWEEHYKTRTNAKGELVHPSVFLNEAKVHQETRMANRAADDSDWMPVGPDYVPQSSNASNAGLARINCITFHPEDVNTFWIGASQGGVWKTTDGGESWTPLNEGLPILRISDLVVDPTDTDIMYAALGDYEYNGVALDLDDRKRHTHYGVGVFKTTNGGLSWQSTGLTVYQEDLDYSLLRRIVIDPDNPQQLVAGGFEGLWKTTDGGDTWTNVMADALISDVEQNPDTPTELYAASTFVSTLDEGSARIFKSTDFGDTWEMLNSGVPAEGLVNRLELAIAPSNTDYLYACAVGLDEGLYGIYRTTDGGDTWSQQAGSSPNIFTWGDGSNGGGQGSYDLAFVVDPLDENRLFGGGINAWGSEDGGVTWNAVSYWLDYYGPSLHADLHQFKYNLLNNKFYVVSDGGVITTDELLIGSWNDAYEIFGYEWPTVWEDLSDGMQITSFYRVGISENNPELMVAGSQDNGTFYFNGNNWSKVYGGDGMNCLLHPDEAGTMVVSSQYGNLVSVTNGGADVDWTISDFILNFEAGEWVTPFIYDNEDDILMAGFGNCWMSEDFGQSWNQISNFEENPSLGYPIPASQIATCENDVNAIYFARRMWHSVGVEDSELWVTFNGGDWVDVTEGLPSGLYFQDIVVDDDNPQLAWVTTSGFEEGQKVYRTDDGGENWINVSYNLPNIPANCLALDEASSNHTLYVGTDLGVYMINDDMSEWEPFDANLPLVIVSDLDINPVTSEMYAATFGRGLWKTDIQTIITGVEEDQFEFSIGLSPNPNNGQSKLTIEADNAHKATLQIVDVMGRVVEHRQFNLPGQQTQVDLDLNLGAGLYYVAVQIGKQREVVNMVVE